MTQYEQVSLEKQAFRRGAEVNFAVAGVAQLRILRPEVWRLQPRLRADHGKNKPASNKGLAMKRFNTILGEQRAQMG